MTLAQARKATDPAIGNPTLSARRTVDIVMASAGLLVFCPCMVLIALAIWLDGGRPILFSQVRLGRLGQHFRIYKFRKFNSECASGCGVTVSHDARFTRLGRFLGATKLDELPQLWNILRGDMTTVGPRPESLSFADCFTRDYRGVLEHKPGIFGPNQFYFRDEGSLYPEACDPEQFYREVLFPLKARIDLAYFPHRTLGADIGWIIRGALGVFGCHLMPAKFNAILAGWLDQQEQQQAV